MILPVLLASCTLASKGLQAEDLKRPVTFAAPATRAAVLFPELSKAVGVAFRTSPQTRDEVFLIQVKNVSAKDLMDRMAAVANAEWRQEGTSYQLVRPPALVRQAEQTEFARKTALIQDEIDRQIKILAQKPPDPSKPSANLGRTILPLLNEIGAARLAAIEQGERVVFALQPNMMQEGLPAAAHAFVRRFIDDQQGAHPGVSIGKTLIVARRLTPWQLDADLFVADTDGKRIGGDFAGFWLMRPSDKVPSGANPIPVNRLCKELVDQSLGDGPLSVHRFLMSGGAVQHQGSGNGLAPIHFRASKDDSIESRARLSAELRNHLLNPEQFDPLQLAAGDAFTFAAKSLEKNLVADLPDSAFLWLYRLGEPNAIGVQDLLEIAAPNAGLEIQSRSGWLTVCARDQASANRDRVDRQGLGMLLRKLDSAHALSLDDLAAYAARQARPSELDTMDGALMVFIDPIETRRIMEYLRDPWPLKIYSTLTATQLAAARAKRPLTVSDLTPEQRRWLELDVYNSDDGPKVSSSKLADYQQSSFFSEDIATERTEYLSQGLPPDGLLWLGIESEPAVLGTDTRRDYSAVVTPSLLASLEYRPQRPDFAALGTAPSFDIFQPATEYTYQFRYQLGSAITFKRTLSGSSVDFDAKPVKYAELPDAFRIEADRQLSGMRSTMLPPKSKQAPPP